MLAALRYIMFQYLHYVKSLLGDTWSEVSKNCQIHYAIEKFYEQKLSLGNFRMQSKDISIILYLCTFQIVKLEGMVQHAPSTHAPVAGECKIYAKTTESAASAVMKGILGIPARKVLFFLPNFLCFIAAFAYGYDTNCDL